MDSTIEKIKAMRCDVRSMAYSGGWAASLGGGSDHREGIHAFADSLEDVVDKLHGKWTAAGSPEWRVFTPEEADVLRVECDLMASDSATGKSIRLSGTGAE